VAFVVAIAVHEAAHAAAAYYLGDPTARLAGRLTLDPRAHLDPMGTLFLLFAGFGWGRPVPVNPYYFAAPRMGQALVSLAGPMANFVIALLLTIPLSFIFEPLTLPHTLLGIIFHINVILMVFNLLPVFPLDGGNLVGAFLPPEAQIQYFQYGPIVLFGLIGLDFVFNTEILWSLLSPLISIVEFTLQLATTFGG
jgi:Zn-dependent protease